MHYSVQPSDQMFLKDYEFCLMLKIWVKILVKT